MLELLNCLRRKLQKSTSLIEVKHNMYVGFPVSIYGVEDIIKSKVEYSNIEKYVV